MSKPRPQKCSCQAVKVDGKCPYGCEAFAKPHETQRSTQSRAKHRAERAVAPIGTRSKRKAQA